MTARVLLIDDDEWFAAQLAHQLEKSGCETVLVRDGLAAMKEIDIAPPDVIVLDLFMPGPNGLVLLHELQSYSDLASIPVVLCTNSAGDIVGVDLSHYGVRRVLDKTKIEPGDIVAAARGVLA